MQREFQPDITVPHNLRRYRALRLAGACVVALLLALGGCHGQPGGGLVGEAMAAPARTGHLQQIRRKAAAAQAAVRRLHAKGRDVRAMVRLMRQVKPSMDAGDIDRAEALLDRVLAMADAGSATGSSAATGSGTPTSGATGAAAEGSFGAPQRVTLRGYDGDAMEPFITRDDRYLLFNNLNDPKVDTDLHYARRISDTEFEYLGPLEGANSRGKTDGVPSLSRDGLLVFVSTRAYDRTHSTLYKGRFDDGRVTDVLLLEGDFSRRRAPWFNMDAEISADGNTLYYVENEFDPSRGRPKSSNILIARRRGDAFYVDPDAARIMARINTSELEYAPAISADERELYFTRAEGLLVGHRAGGANLRIYVARRSRKGEPFGDPQSVSSIEGFVEGPTISGDGKRLYFHRRDGRRFNLYLVRRQ